MDVPFTENEKRFVLAEVIKNSSVPIDRLLPLLSEGQVHISWNEMLLPHGRNLKSCFETFHALTSRSTLALPHILSAPPAADPESHKRKSAPEHFEFTPSAPSPKRRQSGGEVITTTRTLQPKPSSNGSPQAFSPLASSHQPKKRGRPSKADVEARNAEAIARGEVIPPPKAPAPKSQQLSGMGHFDPRSSTGPIQRELVPSPRAIAPSPSMGGEYGHGHSSAQPLSRIAAVAPMMMPPSHSPPSMGTQSDPSESDSATVSGKKKRPRLSSNPKSPRMGESSFQSNSPEASYSQIRPAPGPSAAYTPTEEIARTGAEKLPPLAAQISQAELPHSDPQNSEA